MVVRIITIVRIIIILVGVFFEGRFGRGEFPFPFMGRQGGEDCVNLASGFADGIFDLGDTVEIFGGAIDDIDAEFLVGHFPSAELQGEFDLVAFDEKFFGVPDFGEVIVFADIDPEFYS